MTAAVAPGRLARTFHGITVKRAAVFCGIVAMTAVGSGITMMLMAGKGLVPGLWAFAWQYAYQLPLFGLTGIAVVVAGNWAPTKTGPRVLAFAGAVVVGILAGVLLTAGVMSLWPPRGMEAPGLIKAIGAIVLWSHVIAAGVLGYFFMTREEDAIARLHVEEMRRIHLDRELVEARLQVMQARSSPAPRPSAPSSRRSRSRPSSPSCRRRWSRISSSTRWPLCVDCSRPIRRRRAQ